MNPYLRTVVFASLLALSLSVVLSSIHSQSDALADSESASTKQESIRFSYRAQQISGFNDIVELYRITESAFADSFTTNIEMCRLDLIQDADTESAYYSIGSGLVVIPVLTQQSLDSLRQIVLSTPLAKSLSKHSLNPTGEIDTFDLSGGMRLEAYRYDVLLDNKNREDRAWIAPCPFDLEHYPLLSSVEYLNRNSSFVANEQFRRIINLLLLRGVEFPPGSGKIRDDLMLVRFDNRKDELAFTSRVLIVESQLEEIKQAE